MDRKVYIRVDGSPEIGLGHLVRCIALAQMLDNNFRIYFICKEIPEETSNEIKKLGFNITIIEKEENFLSQLKNDDFVVIDHYALDSNYQKSIKEKGCKLICIDDLHDKVFFADLIINHAPNVKITDYKAQPFTKFALGLDYALLRPEFLEEAQKERIIQNTDTVFICFGGADFKNLSTQILLSVLEENKFKKVIIVTGAGFKHTAGLQEAIKNDIRVQHEHSIDVHRMLELMKISGFAIIPASGILFEVIAVGIKPLICYFVDNQKEFHDYLVGNYNIPTMGYLDGGFEKFSPSISFLLETGDEKKNKSLIGLRSKISKSKENCLKKFKEIL